MPVISSNRNLSSPFAVVQNCGISSSKFHPPSWQTGTHDAWLATRHPHDAVIAAMARNPASTRMELDASAQDEGMHFNENELSALLFKTGSDPHCLRAAVPLAYELYRGNATFRRLVNHFSSASAGRAKQCKLAAGDSYSMTVTNEQIEAKGEKTLTLVLDHDRQPSQAGSISARRAMTHELLHHITRLCDDNSTDNPRGAIVEYANIVLAGLEEAREAYGEKSGHDTRSPEGVGGKYQEEQERIWGFVASASAGWREQAIGTIAALPAPEIAMLRERLPNLDRMRREASHEDFSILQGALADLCNKMENPSRRLVASCNDFESRRRDINKKIELASMQSDRVSEKANQSAGVDYSLAVLAGVSQFDPHREAYKARCRQAELEQSNRADRDRAIRDHRSRELTAESTLAIALINETQPRKIMVTVATEYEVRTTRGTVVDDPHGRTANRPHGLQAVRDVAGAPPNASAPSHVKTVKTETPTFQKYVIKEEVAVNADASGQFRTRDLKSFAGTGSSHSTVIMSKNRLPGDVEITRGQVVETARGSTSYTSTKELSALAGPSFKYAIEAKKETLSSRQLHGGAAHHQPITALTQVSETGRFPVRHANLTALAKPAYSTAGPIAVAAPRRNPMKQLDAIFNSHQPAPLHIAARQRGRAIAIPQPLPSSLFPEQSKTTFAALAAPGPAFNARSSGQSAASKASNAVAMGAGAGAGAGASHLEKYLQPTVIALPMDGVFIAANGKPEISLNGYRNQIVYDPDAGMWRTADKHAAGLAYDGRRWRRLPASEEASARGTGPAPSDTTSKPVTLPVIRPVSADVKPIPKDIHYTWIGKMMSEINIKNIISNAEQSYDKKTGTGYRTIVHVDADSPVIFAEITAKFIGSGSNVVVENLRESDFFQAFKRTGFGVQYDAVRNGKYPCYSVASDILRYPLINHEGGVYIDVDDTIHEDVSFSDLPASRNDLLLHELHSNEKFGMKNEYNGSILGSHPNNPLLNAISERMHALYLEDPTFFDRERPYISAGDDAASMETYAKKIYTLTGPGLLNEVLREHIPDAYGILEVDKARSYIKLPEEYQNARIRSHEHHHPFYSLWNITIGCDHSWQST